MSWAQDRRMDWIDDMLTDRGWIIRQHVQDYFGIGPAQAAQDFADFRKLDANFRHDTKAKCHVRKGPSVRNSTPERRKAWALFGVSVL